MSNEISEEMVRERAQAIWQREGCPDGDAERHWAMAEAELQAEVAERSATPSKKRPAQRSQPRTRPPPRSPRPPAPSANQPQRAPAER